MSVCDSCTNRKERPCTYTARTREYAKFLLPALRQVAYRYGFALAVHGSLKTDIDLVAVPWRESAVGGASLVEAIRAAAEAIHGYCQPRKFQEQPTKKPCGRLAWSFYMQPEGCGPGPYIDLSVMPVFRDDEQEVLEKFRQDKAEKRRLEDEAERAKELTEAKSET